VRIPSGRLELSLAGRHRRDILQTHLPPRPCSVGLDFKRMRRRVESLCWMARCNQYSGLRVSYNETDETQSRN